MADILITICARGGSKGIPGKNIKMLNNKPLIYYSLQVAQQFANKKGNTQIVLSTDDAEIKNVVKELSATTDIEYSRPEILANDTAGKLDAITDAKNYAEEKYQKKYDYVIDLDVTSPLRNLQDLENALQLLERNSEAYNIFSVSPANRNPYFNMVEENDNGYYSLCKKGLFLTRQSAPKVFDMNASFYIFKNNFFSTGNKTVITEKSLVYEVPHICFDLDHPIDFEIMSFLIENSKLNFDFIQE
ncbi:acylneuraminate cytidylyltransferase family protein [Kaistella jeonii]|uniref:Cytidyltransferase n=1 Tax=Kaistella jeonii TaxID=266749 RepID=A0A0C1F7H7_9FLAO|nr:acylneuraminate cytidylyltransferase family protein [Kaistella jeonii]KIA89122.1 cytidyltransferase [Kaistella jeonii]SFB93856.1 N-acylneuraminate cytidylyltransferase/CMP-N,N'-diacetyllegionaminic acid synthase [Kaistella jeonii]VEI97063.1 N-acylneuraminate cytidylyltransferase [Kaistella jeonii]